MIRLCLPALAAVLCVAGAARAQDHSPVHLETFREICLNNEADPEKAIVAAQARGWLPAPRELVDGYLAEGGIETNMLVNIDGDLARMFNDPAFAILMIGAAPADLFGGMQGDYCGLMPRSGDPEAVRRGLQDWVGFAPTADDADRPLWVYTITDGAKTPPTDLGEGADDEAYEAEMRARQHYFVGMMEGFGGPATFMLRPTP